MSEPLDLAPSYVEACELAIALQAIPIDELDGPRWISLVRRTRAVIEEVVRQGGARLANETDLAADRLREAEGTNPVDRDFALREAGGALARALSTFGPVRLGEAEGGGETWALWARETSPVVPSFLRARVDKAAGRSQAIVENSFDSPVGEGPDGFQAVEDLRRRLEAGARAAPAPIVISDVNVLGVSLVPAPRCPECGETMGAASASTWACRRSGCPREGQAVDLGIYPFRPVGLSGPPEVQANLDRTFANLGIQAPPLGRAVPGPAAAPTGPRPAPRIPDVAVLAQTLDRLARDVAQTASIVGRRLPDFPPSLRRLICSALDAARSLDLPGSSEAQTVVGIAAGLIDRGLQAIDDGNRGTGAALLKSAAVELQTLARVREVVLAPAQAPADEGLEGPRPGAPVDAPSCFGSFEFLRSCSICALAEACARRMDPEALCRACPANEGGACPADAPCPVGHFRTDKSQIAPAQSSSSPGGPESP